MENEINIRFLSKRSNISIIRNMIAAAIVDNNPTVSFLNELKTIASEAITNSIVHGYNNDENKYIELKMIVLVDKIILKIQDYGCGIKDILKAKEPLFSTKKDEERSGLGFTIMELFSDKMTIDSTYGKGTTIYIEKNW